MTSSGTYSFAPSNADLVRDALGRVILLPDMQPAIVYCVKNIKKDNSVAYVGCTEKTLERRKSKHLQNAARGQISKFYSAIRKYGPDAFTWGVIEECASYMEALGAEREAIKKLMPRYNMTSGGGGIKGYKHSPSSIQKMSDAKKGRPVAWLLGPNAQEIKKKLSGHGKRKRPILTQAHIQKMRRNARLANLTRHKPVLCITDGNSFPSVTAAAHAYGVDTSSICNWCNGIKSCRGLIFKRLG